MEGLASNPPVDGPARGGRLDSWKEIAVYLGRDVRTVQRWERREGLPIHRHQHDKLGSVYAFRDEIDAWTTARTRASGPPESDGAAGSHLTAGEKPGPTTEPDVPPGVAPMVFGGRWRRGPVAVGAVATVVTLLAAWGFLRPARMASDAAGSEIKSIVVTPFEDLSSPKQELFAAGLTEEVTGRLAQLMTLRVVSRTSAMSLEGRKVPAPTIAREMDVDGLVEGSVRREGGRVRISVQLIDARTDTHRWAREFDREEAAAWPLQMEVAQAVAEAIRVQTTPEERARLAAQTSINSAAREEYLIGRHLLWKAIEQDRVRAMEHFGRAIHLEPQWAAPYAALAHAWWMRGAFGVLSLHQVTEPAREAALAALARDQRNGEAHAALAYVQGMFDWEWDRAQASVERAVALEPNNVGARYVQAVLLMAMARLDQATSAIDYAARLDPLSAQVHSTYGRVLYRARKFEDARVRLERALELEPRNPGIYTRLANVYEQLGRYDDALGALDSIKVPNVREPTPISGVRARVLAQAGRMEEARQLLALLPPQGAARAEVLASLGDHDGAFSSLFRALDQRDSWLMFIKSDPVFDKMHDDPRWIAVLRRMNLADESSSSAAGNRQNNR